ncbi:hypothetical protein Bbelb_018230 [Branchiostoma belcheri]|nr:hypothetical protein Bbelb_018230 [Branchiostoma belcheri]
MSQPRSTSNSLFFAQLGVDTFDARRRKLTHSFAARLLASGNGIATIHQPESTSPAEWGWAKCTSGDTWDIFWTTLPPIVESCQQLTKCGCKLECPFYHIKIITVECLEQEIQSPEGRLQYQKAPQSQIKWPAFIPHTKIMTVASLEQEIQSPEGRLQYQKAPLGGAKVKSSDPPPEFQLDTSEPSWKEIQEVVRKARAGSAPGPSRIPYKVYKKCPLLLRRLWRLLRRIWVKGTIPECWKKAEGCLVPKQENLSTTNQFRTISLLSVECKIYFSILARRMVAYVTKNKYTSTPPCRKGESPTSHDVWNTQGYSAR